MAHQGASKEKSILWLIFPIAVALTFLFIYRNRSAAHEKGRLDGNVPRIEAKHSPAATDHTPAEEHSADTTHVNPTEAPAAETSHGSAH